MYDISDAFFWPLVCAVAGLWLVAMIVVGVSFRASCALARRIPASEQWHTARRDAFGEYIERSGYLGAGTPASRRQSGRT